MSNMFLLLIAFCVVFFVLFVFVLCLMYDGSIGTDYYGIVESPVLDSYQFSIIMRVSVLT